MSSGRLLLASLVLAALPAVAAEDLRALEVRGLRGQSQELAADDRLWMLEVFYAGGTATRDFSAADIVDEIAARGTQAEFAPSRDWLAGRIAEEAKEGDVVLVMGARDPSLTAFARDIVGALGA